MSESSNLKPLSNESSRGNEDGEINILDLLIILAKYKRIVFGLPLVAAIIAAAVSIQIPNTFTATTRILPPQNQSSASAMLAQQLGGLAGLAGGISGIKNPNDLYIGMLKSRTVADNLIQRFDLNKLYQKQYQSDTRGQLAQRSSISSGKDGIITIEVDDQDSKRAAELANAYVVELFKLTNVLAVTEASQRRLFFERQLNEAKDSLIRAEAAARQGLETGGLVQVEGQGRALIELTGRLRGQITVKEVQIGAMRSFAAERNPELKAAQQELDAMKRELAKIEGASEKKSPVPIEPKAGGMTSVGLLRNVKYFETIYELLAKQYELAKIEEAKDSAVVQVMDKAVEPDRKSKPRRTVIVLLSALVAGFVGIVLAFLLHAISSLREDPRESERLARLKANFRNRIS